LIPAAQDTIPGTLLFMSSVLGLGWWIFGAIIYVPNVAGLKNGSG